MQLPFFYEPSITTDTKVFNLSETSTKHAVQVLRMKVEEELNITNGIGLLSKCVIIDISKKSCTVQVKTTQQVTQPQKKMAIGISLLKNSHRLEWFLEKVTELGIVEIILLQCHRTEKLHFRLDRLNGILIAAMLQSQQVWLPVLQNTTSIQQLVTTCNYTNKFIAHCNDVLPKTPLQQANMLQQNAIILIGPEGDFTTTEIQQALANNFIPVSLGNTRLRTETAGIVAATLLINS